MPAKRTGPERFSDRVENYVRFRPDYPPEVIALLVQHIGLAESWVIADVGSGTGLSSQLFLENGNQVYGIEPNLPMRMAAQRFLAGYQGFHSVAGSAEATTLAAHSVHCVVAAQAFHWFDPAAAGAEARRIVRPGGWAVLLWNTRRLVGTTFLEAYERLQIEFGSDYQQIRHDKVAPDMLATFFGGDYEKRSLANGQRLTLEGLRGRILSSSYMPTAGDPRFAECLAAIDEAFAANEANGRVEIEYDVDVYWARIG